MIYPVCLFGQNIPICTNEPKILHLQDGVINEKLTFKQYLLSDIQLKAKIHLVNMFNQNLELNGELSEGGKPMLAECSPKLTSFSPSPTCLLPPTFQL